MNNKWIGHGRKLLWPNLRYCLSTYLEGLRKITKVHSPNSQSLGWDLNPGHPKYKCVHTTGQLHLLFGSRTVCELSNIINETYYSFEFLYFLYFRNYAKCCYCNKKLIIPLKYYNYHMLLRLISQIIRQRYFSLCVYFKHFYLPAPAHSMDGTRERSWKSSPKCQHQFKKLGKLNKVF